MRGSRYVWLVAFSAAAIGAAPRALDAQIGTRFSLTGSGSFVESRRATPDAEVVLSGLVLGAAGSVAWGRVALRAGYAEGALEPDAEDLTGSDYVEGFLALGAAVLPGVEISAGPRARAHVMEDGGTERWLQWELGVRYDAPIIRPAVRGYIEARGAVAGDRTLTESFDSGLGGAAGAIVCPAHGPFGLRLSYAFDEARFGAGARTERVEMITLAVSYNCE